MVPTITVAKDWTYDPEYGAYHACCRDGSGWLNVRLTCFVCNAQLPLDAAGRTAWYALVLSKNQRLHNIIMLSLEDGHI
jgi:hypothetical protein